MTAPLTVNTNTDVEIVDSCNCCFPFRRRRHKKAEEKVDKVFQEHIKEDKKPRVELIKVKKDRIQSLPSLRTSGEWIFEREKK